MNMISITIHLVENRLSPSRTSSLAPPFLPYISQIKQNSWTGNNTRELHIVTVSQIPTINISSS
jgi:hypothetical protein